jgi:hypothetical protein
VLDHTVEQGNPADAPQLAPAIERGVELLAQREVVTVPDEGLQHLVTGVFKQLNSVPD